MTYRSPNRRRASLFSRVAIMALLSLGTGSARTVRAGGAGGVTRRWTCRVESSEEGLGHQGGAGSAHTGQAAAMPHGSPVRARRDDSGCRALQLAQLIVIIGLAGG